LEKEERVADAADERGDAVDDLVVVESRAARGARRSDEAAVGRGEDEAAALARGSDVGRS